MVVIKKVLILVYNKSLKNLINILFLIFNKIENNISNILII